MAGTKLRARIRPLTRGNDEIDEVAIELSNLDGSPYSPGGGGGGAVSAGWVVQGQGIAISSDENGGALLWGNDPNLHAAGVDLADYVDANELLLPQGVYLGRFESYFDPGVDEGGSDLDRTTHLNLTGAPGDWTGLTEYGFDLSPEKAAGGWAETMIQVYKAFPFVIWADHQTAQVYVTTSSAAPVDFTVNLLIAKIADLPA